MRRLLFSYLGTFILWNETHAFSPSLFSKSNSSTARRGRKSIPKISMQVNDCILPFALSLEELAAQLGSHDAPKMGRAKLLWKALSQGYNPWNGEGCDIIGPEIIRRTISTFEPPSWKITGESTSSCGTKKLLLRFKDGVEIETVLIPSLRESRTTLCVSSQVGCNRACSFCATGRMGFIRNLSADEILAQVYEARRAVRTSNMPPLNNIVFMGMGEPLNNSQSVKLALMQLTNHFMFAIGTGHISVSTVGPSPYAILQMQDMLARLAWSVHAADDSTRRLLVPTTAHKMTELRDAFVEVLSGRGNEHLFVEVAMLDGINDTSLHAHELADLLDPLPGKTRVNLLPYNDIGQKSFRPSTAESIKDFQSILQHRGLIATIRTSRGAPESAACGQLATLHR